VGSRFRDLAYYALLLWLDGFFTFYASLNLATVRVLIDGVSRETGFTLVCIGTEE